MAARVERSDGASAGAAELVAQAREEAQLAIDELRDLVRGIHPALLSDRGLRVELLIEPRESREAAIE